MENIKKWGKTYRICNIFRKKLIFTFWKILKMEEQQHTGFVDKIIITYLKKKLKMGKKQYSWFVVFV